MAFLKSSIKKSNSLEIHLSLQVLPVAHVFPLWLHLFLISLLLSWGRIPAVIFLTAADFWEQLSKSGVQNNSVPVIVWNYKYLIHLQSISEKGDLFPFSCCYYLPVRDSSKALCGTPLCHYPDTPAFLGICRHFVLVLIQQWEPGTPLQLGLETREPHILRARWSVAFWRQTELMLCLRAWLNYLYVMRGAGVTSGCHIGGILGAGD